MKIKTKTLSYDEVMKLPGFTHRPPRRPLALLRAAARIAGASDLKAVNFSYTTERMEELGEGPYLILMNHSSFIDLEIAAHMLRSAPYCIVCTTDTLVGKEWLMRGLGCIPTGKFVTDLTLLADIRHALSVEGCSVLMYPEAGYSFDGRATVLPQRLGVMLKRLDVPVVGILTEGAFTRDPLYNCLQKRDVTVTATMRGLLTREEIAQKSVEELDAVIADMFSFDNFRAQAEKDVETRESFRADGLHRILYKCAHCGAEGETEGRGTRFVCHSCGKEYEMDTLGRLHAAEGETEFSHIPDWYDWERAEVRREIEKGTYRLDTEVDISMLVDYKALYSVGSGRLVHDAEGFTLTGCDGKLSFSRSTNQCYTLNSDFFWYELGDVIGIGDTRALYYCFPKGNVSVAKARLATEELYKMQARKRGKM